MRIVDGISREEFWNSLAGKSNLAAEFKRWTGEYAKEIDRELAARLCLYLEEWIDTGIKQDGSECPFDRDITATSQALPAIEKWGESHPPYLKMVPGETLLFLGRAIDHIGGEEAQSSPKKAVSNRAACVFFSFLTTDWRFHVYKCRRCLAYFDLGRKPRKSYSRGMHCKNCASSATAAHYTTVSRKRRDQERIKCATVVFRALGKMYQTPDSGEVAQQMNKKLGAKMKSWHVTKNWVTRNRALIAKSAEASSAKD